MRTMPRRQRRPVPLRRRGTREQAQMPVTLKGRHARKLASEIIKANQQQGKNGTAARNDALARSGAWRFRRHLPPFWWLAGLLAAALILPATPHPLVYGVIASVIVPVLMVKFTRHLPAFSRRAAEVAAVLTSLWLPPLATFGLHVPVPAWLLGSWAPCAALWVRHYRWRPTEPEPFTPTDTTDADIWARLAAKRRWAGHLVSPEQIPGGRKWEIALDGIETHIGQVMAEPKVIAAAWDKPQTEAYVEPHASGIESRGMLTILKAGTLETVREWDGQGIDENGVGRIGRFADSKPAHVRFFVRRDGTRHGLIAGASGAGKSALLNQIVWLAITSKIPIVPVILDPQNGQSLPQWQGKVLYAAGVDECITMLRGLHAGMLGRSRDLSRMTWTDASGHVNRGLAFFDPDLTGLPVILIIVDEAPVMLTADGNAKLGAEAIRLMGQIGKLGRKTGVSLWPVAQVPSLAELGDQVVRSMLVGGKVVCLRTGDRVSAGMLGLEAEPSALPKYFPNGESTGGLGYVVGPDNRQAPMRVDLVPESLHPDDVTVPALDDRFAAVMHGAMGAQGTLLPDAPAGQPAGAPPADDGPEGRRCVDAVWQVLSARSQDMDRGEVISWVNDLATGAWERPKPFSIRAVSDALRDLAAGKYPDRAVTKPRDGVYRATLDRAADEAREGEA